MKDCVVSFKVPLSKYDVSPTIKCRIMVLKEVPSGKIEIIETENGEPLLQFNCSCLDALPYCRAACCKGRPGFNVGLEQDELDKYEWYIADTLPGQPLIQYEGDCCKYLTNDCKCVIHLDKPKTCQKWHCSPGGIGDGVQIRSEGWRLRIANLTGQ
jgi:hypothetical protein